MRYDLNLGMSEQNRKFVSVTDLGDKAGFLTHAQQQPVLLNHEGLWHPPEQAGKSTDQNWFAAALLQKKNLRFFCSWKQTKK